MFFRVFWIRAALPTPVLTCSALTAAAADEDFFALTQRLQAEKPQFAQRQQALLEQRYLRTHADGKWNDNLLAQAECGSDCRID